MSHKFPKGFYFGAATSSHQVEGGNHNDWTEWEHANSARLAKESELQFGELPSWPMIKDQAMQPENYISGRAADHYHRFREDFDLARSLGHNAHRFSIEWSRIEPTEGTFNEQELLHYRDVIHALRERGITPFVTIWHWTLPLWLRNKGGVLAKGFPHYFERYAEKLAKTFHGDVKFWITINEPEIYSLNSYLRGIWPPQKRSIVKFYRSIVGLIRAHRRAYHAIKKIQHDAEIGVSLNMTYFESAGGFVNNLLTWIAEHAWNEHYLRHTIKTLDFIGLNYYFHNRIDYGLNKNPKFAQRKSGDQNLEHFDLAKKNSDMGWELYPQGIEKVMGELVSFKKPIYITENGLADTRDEYRGEFIKTTIKSILRATQKGADVRGYFHWSLLDNFEWDKGFWPRFGLIEVDYATQKRTVRQSAHRYQQIIKEHTEL